MKLNSGVALALLSAAATGCTAPSSSSSSSSSSSPSSSPIPLSLLLADTPGDTSGFQRALAPRPFVFPDDDGPHPQFRSEWWYFTGILRAGARRFGYEMTIFRRALTPASPVRPSAWATRDLYMADLAVSDIDGDAGGHPAFHAYQHFARDGLALAGARALPFAVWVDDWRMDGPAGGVATLPIHLAARDESGAAIDLLVGDAASIGSGAVVAEGDRGLSAKGPDPGQASYYYSRPRLATRGQITLPGAVPATSGPAHRGAAAAWPVSGTSWMDREWSTGALGPDVRGWDWLGVHLSDGRDLMLYRLRDAAGRATRESRLTLIDPHAASRSFTADQFSVTPLDTWQSPHTGTAYPIAVRIEVPGAGLRVDVRALQVNQELRFAVTYWEGAVAVRGEQAGVTIDGEGYLELTGYRDDQRQR